MAKKIEVMELPLNLFKYWFDTVHQESLENPNSGLMNLYESMMKFYNKYRGIKK